MNVFTYYLFSFWDPFSIFLNVRKNLRDPDTPNLIHLCNEVSFFSIGLIFHIKLFFIFIIIKIIIIKYFFCHDNETKEKKKEIQERKIQNTICVLYIM